MPPGVMSWIEQHPLQTLAGVVFVISTIFYVAVYHRINIVLRLLLGLFSLAAGAWFGWEMFKLIDLTKLAPAVGGIFAVLFVLTLIDDADGGGWRGRYGRGGEDLRRFW